MNIDDIYNKVVSEEVEDSTPEVQDEDINGLIDELRKTASESEDSFEEAKQSNVDKPAIKGDQSTRSKSLPKQNLKEKVFLGAKGDAKYKKLYEKVKKMALGKEASIVVDELSDELVSLFMKGGDLDASS